MSERQEMDVNSDEDQKNRRPGCWIGIPLFLLALIVLPLMLWIIGRFLVVSDPLVISDAVVVLGGDRDLSRLERAVAHYQAGYAEWLIVTDTEENYSEYLSYGQYLKREAAKMGVPEARILLTEMSVSSTWEEARAVRKLMLRYEFASCIVVTDPYHSRRSRISFRDDFKAHGLEARMDFTRDHWYRPSRWFLSGRGWQATALEYFKLFGYWLGFEHLEVE
ncbi:MAG: YdcF family protein [Anaerolineaceae bacterium]|nr:YdcF family protein [Anaerolineaceae bacterium]